MDYDIYGMLESHEIFPRDLKSLKVRLSVPKPDEECPIALEPISSAELSFLPGCSFFKDIPELTKMTLPCGHSFSAMVIIYSWCKSNMRCPCCRQGLECKANVKHLPSHFKDQLAAQLSTLRQSERADEERDTIANILQMTPITTSFTELAEDRCLEILVTFYFRPANDAQRLESLFRPANQRRTETGGRFSMMVPLTAVHTFQRNRAVVIFRPSAGNMHVLQQSPNGVQSISVTTQMRIRNAGIINVDSSGEIDFPAPMENPADLARTPRISRRVIGYTERQQDNSTLPVVPISTFELSFAQRGNQVYLYDLTWIPDSSHVHVSMHSLPEST
jgi:hypothetical protein